MAKFLNDLIATKDIREEFGGRLSINPYWDFDPSYKISGLIWTQFQDQSKIRLKYQSAVKFELSRVTTF